MELQNKVSGIAHDTNVAKITVMGAPDQPGIAGSLFEPLAKANISVDTIVQNVAVNEVTDVTFTVSRTDVLKALSIVEPVARSMGARDVSHDETLAKVSIIGTGMQNTPGYAARMFSTLSEHDVNIQLITTSEIRITCIIAEDRVQEAVRALHEAFEVEFRQQQSERT